MGAAELMLMLEGSGGVCEIGEVGGGGSGGGVVDTMDAWQMLGFDEGGTFGMVRVGRAVTSAVDVLVLDRFNK